MVELNYFRRSSIRSPTKLIECVRPVYSLRHPLNCFCFNLVIHFDFLANMKAYHIVIRPVKSFSMFAVDVELCVDPVDEVDDEEGD